MAGIELSSRRSIKMKLVAMASATLALLSAAPNAEASKARIDSQQGALGLIDTQTIFSQPAYIHKLNRYMTYEFGSASTAAAAAPKAEGGFAMEANGARFGAYLGHLDSYQNALRDIDGFQRQDNPVDIFFGKNNWGANISFSNSEDETITPAQKQMTLIGRAGLIRETDEFSAALHLIGSAEKAGGTKFSGAPLAEVSYLKRADLFTFRGLLSYGMGKTNNGTGDVDLRETRLELAAMHRPISEVYVGIAGTFTSIDRNGAKIEVAGLPVSMGLEKDLFSWLTLRGSLKQNVVLGTNKATLTGSAKRNVNDTTVAAGLGIKYLGFIFDGSLIAAGTGLLNTSNFLSQASMTYNF